MSTAKRVKVLANISGLVLALFALWAAPAKAAIIGTYVDADPTVGTGNTTSAGFTNVNLYNDNSWFVRTTQGTNSTVIEAGGSSENPPLITTSYSGLDSGAAYDIYVLFGSPVATPWSVRAALSGGILAEFDNTTPGIIDTGLFPGNAGLHLYEAKLGTVTGVTSFAVDIRNSTHTDGVPAGTLYATFYDGVAYNALPEPSGLAVLGAGMILSCRRRAGK